MKSMEMLSALLPPGGERPLALSTYVGLQALLDAVPVALMEFRLLRDGCLVLLSANTAARRTPGLERCMWMVPMRARCSTNWPARR